MPGSQLKEKIFYMFHKGDKQSNEPFKNVIVNTCSWRGARENVYERVMIGFPFTSDWIKKWREYF